MAGPGPGLPSPARGNWEGEGGRGGVCFPDSEGKSRKVLLSSRSPLKIVAGDGPGTVTFPRTPGWRFLETQHRPTGSTLHTV